MTELEQRPATPVTVTPPIQATTVPEPAPAPPAPVVDRPRDISSWSADDLTSLVGAAVGSLGLSWLLYYPLLGWSGKLGFSLFWYALFVATYCVLTAMTNPLPAVVDRFVATLVSGAALVVGASIAHTVGYIVYRGWPALHHVNFYTHDMAGVRPTSELDQGGVLHAIVGSGLEVLIAVLISMPLGVGTAIFMTEVRGRGSKVVRTVVEAMTALPDILAGLFVYAFLIIGLHWQRTGFAAALALSVTMIPIVARSAEVVLRLVPHGLREASWALGASQWRTVRLVVLPTARAGLATSLILGIARIAGETAPLLIVSGSSTFMNHDPFNEPMNSLPLFVFTSIRSGQTLYAARGYGAAVLLLLIVTALFALTRFLARDKVRPR